MKILAVHEFDDRKIRIVERDDGSRIYLENDIPYTHVDAAGDNLLPYATAMDRALKDATDALLLGTAGGAVARQFSRRGVKVTAVDNLAVTFDVAREWFDLPQDVECVHADALEFLRVSSRQWDAIAVDVFFQGKEIPESMLGVEIGSLLARALRPGGSIAWNVADSLQSWSVHWVSKALRQAGFSPRPIAVVAQGAGNTIVVCRTPAV